MTDVVVQLTAAGTIAGRVLDRDGEPLANVTVQAQKYSYRDGERVLNNRAVRSRALPSRLPRALARHCAEEYANLASLLPELHARFGARDD